MSDDVCGSLTDACICDQIPNDRKKKKKKKVNTNVAPQTDPGNLSGVPIAQKDNTRTDFHSRWHLLKKLPPSETIYQYKTCHACVEGYSMLSDYIKNYDDGSMRETQAIVNKTICDNYQNYGHHIDLPIKNVIGIPEQRKICFHGYAVRSLKPEIASSWRKHIIHPESQEKPE